MNMLACQNKEEVDFTKLKVGKSLVHTLEGNPSTGYSWQYEISNPECLSIAVEMVEENKDILIVGLPVKMKYTFTGKRAGETQIIFNYKRPWEQDEKPVKSDTLDILVEN
jgi:inhibitor of cysteine peptidase